MASTSVTSAAVFIRTVISALAQRAFEAQLVMAARSSRWTAEDGSTIQKGLISNITPTAVVSGDAIVYTATTENSVSMSINRHFYAGVDIEDITKVQANLDLAKEYASKLSYSLKRQLDTDLTGLYSGLSKTAGTLNGGFDDNALRFAVRQLDDDDVTEEDRTFAFRPIVSQEMLGIDKYVDQSFLGELAKKGPLQTGLIGQRYGLAFFKTTQINTTGGQNNLVFQREAFSYAIQKPLIVEKMARTNLTTPVLASMLWGRVESRDVAAVLMRS